MKWISVKDRLPEEDRDVLALYKQKESDIRLLSYKSYNSSMMVSYMYEDFVWDELLCQAVNTGELKWNTWEEVTHWMPLPSGPKKDQESAKEKTSCDWNKSMFPEGCKSENMLVMLCSGVCSDEMD